MNKGLICIAITTYNCPRHIDGLLKSLVYQQYPHFYVIVADDGSTDNTKEVIRLYEEKLDIKLLELKHGERGVARVKAIDEARKLDCEFMFFVDGDMMLKKETLLYASDHMLQKPKVDGLVIKELPYSNYTNFFTKVKLFEREVLNNSIVISKEHSIEAARFWRLESYNDTGGINAKQIAFEEIQPTLRCLDQGGCIEKLQGTGLYHDEKEVTLMNILMKKNYYFSHMSTTIDSEQGGFMKALKRWYLFRPVYYTKKNLYLYLRHPLLTTGMVFMYFLLTLSAAYHMIKFLIKNNKPERQD